MADIGKVKRNIQRMISMDAPEADIDAYVASEGVTLEQLRGAPSMKEAPAAKAPESDTPTLDKIATFAGGVVEGIPVVGPYLRKAPERAAAAVLAPFSDKSYSEIVDMIEADKTRMKGEHPILDTGSQVAGAIASTIPMAATSLGAKALGIVGGNLATRAGAGLASGAIIGGADALVRSDGDLGDAAKGAGLGGIIGGAVPIVGAGIGAGVRAAKAAASPATQALANRIRPEGQAADLTLKALQRDGISIDEAGQKLAVMQKTAPDAVLADVGGSNIRGLARGVVNTPGPQREVVQSFIEARNLAQPQRITEMVSSVLKNPDDFGKTASRMAAERERIAGPIYDEAFSKAQPVNVNGVVQYIDSKVLPGATDVMSPLSDLRPDGLTATIGKLRGFFATERNQRFDLRQLHQIKMELDGLIGTAKRAGDDTKARAVLGVQNRLVKAMDQASPMYKKARDIYSSTYEMEDALEFGRGVFRMRPDEVKATVSGMTPAQRELVQVGLSRAIADAVSSMRDGRDVVKVIFGTPAVRAAIKAAFSDPQSFRKFQLALMRETKMRRTADAVRGNSTTAAQLSDLIDMKGGGGIGSDVFSLLMAGQPVQAAASAVRQVVKGETGLNEKVAERLSDMLLSTEPSKVQAAIAALSKRQGALERIHKRISTVGAQGAGSLSQAVQVPYRSSLSE